MQVQVKAEQCNEIQRLEEIKAPLDELVQESVKGNAEAIGALCQKIARDVLFRTEYILRSRMDAEDAAQEILIRVCENIRRLRNPKMFGVWLDRIIINETRRFMSKNYKHSNNVVDIQDYLDAVKEDNSDYIPQDSADRKESRKIVMGIIDNLPDRQRQVLLLCFYGERSVTEAAKVLGITRSSASHSLSTAKKKVQREIEKISGKSNSILQGLAMVPGGTLLMDILREESAICTASDVTWVEQAVSRCNEIIATPGALEAIGAIGAASVAGIAAAGAKVSAGVTGAALNNTIIAPLLAVTASAVIAVAGLASYPVEQEPPATRIAVENIEYAVVFAGGAGAEHINPAFARAVTDSSHGAFIAYEWTIMPASAGEDSVLFSGKGGVVDEAFAQMVSGGMSGGYILCFVMEDAAGTKYLLSREFTISVN